MSNRERIAWGMLTLLLLAIAALAAPGLLSTWRTVGFQSTLASGLLATFAGAAGGVPVGLYVGRYLQLGAEAARREADDALTRARRDRLLALFRDELTSDLALFRAGMPVRQAGDQPVQTLRDDMWRAASDAGDLGLVRDLGLLRVIADAYHHVRLVAHYEGLATQSRFLTALTIGGVPASQIVLQLLTRTELETAVLGALDGAITSIDAALTQSSPV